MEEEVRSQKSEVRIKKTVNGEQWRKALER
jgi:hypothetical protein